MAFTYNTETDQGSTFTRVFVCRGEDEDKVDFTDYTARMQLRESVDASDFVLEMTTENGMIVLGGVDGTVTWNVDAETMADLGTPGVTASYRYDMEVVNGPTVTKLLKGKIKVVGEVTR